MFFSNNKKNIISRVRNFKFGLPTKPTKDEPLYQYDTTLTQRLVKGHREIIQLLDKIFLHYKSRNYSKMQCLMIPLKKTLHLLLLEKNRHFYTFIEHHYPMLVLKIIKQRKATYNTVSRVAAFCNHYNHIEFTTLIEARFEEDFENIRLTLIKQFNIEEEEFFSL